jgi:fructokinase
MQKKKYEKILCFGEVLWDMLSSGAKPGGAPLNAAIHLKKQGESPILVSKTGNDAEGKELIRFITAAGLETRLIQTDYELPTSKVLVHLDGNKNATYEICEPVAWDNIEMNRETEEEAAGAGLIIYGSLASRRETTRKTLLEIFEASEAVRLLDVNLRPPYDNPKWIEKLLHYSDFIKLNDFELATIASWNKMTGKTNRLITWFSEFYQCPEVCVPRGENGAIFLSGTNIYEHPGFRVNTVDTVGAGDSFLASLVASLSNHTHPQVALEKACATGALVASRRGAVPDYSENDIKEIINSSAR